MYKVESLERINGDVYLWALVERAAAENAAKTRFIGDWAFEPVQWDCIVVARNLDGEVLGFAVWRPSEPNHLLFIGLAWVRPDMRRQGVYRAIVEYLRNSVAPMFGLHGVWACVDERNVDSMKAHAALMKPNLTIFAVETE